MKESRSVGGRRGRKCGSLSFVFLALVLSLAAALVIGSELAHWVIFLRTFESQIWLSNKLCLQRIRLPSRTEN